MSRHSFSWPRFYKMPIIGIARNISPKNLEHILPVYEKAGLTNVEVTMNSADCEESIRMATEGFSEKLNIGAGTVCTEEDLEVALKAGARFIVTPIVNLKVIETCKQLHVPIFAGAFTPTEIFTAWNMGADMVKLFPATNGTEYIRQLRGPFREIKLLPTGAVDLQNCAAYMKAGANAVGIGGHLFDKKHIEQSDWDGLYLHFTSFVNELQEFSK